MSKTHIKIMRNDWTKAAVFFAVIVVAVTLKDSWAVALQAGLGGMALGAVLMKIKLFGAPPLQTDRRSQ